MEIGGEDEKQVQIETGQPDGAIPYAEDFSLLKEPLYIGTKQVPNRIAYQAMEGCDGTPDGRPDTLTKRRYDRFAKGGPGIIWFEATAVQPEARANPHQLYLSEKNKDAFAQILYNIKETCIRENGYEPIVIIQLTHSGRYSRPQKNPEPLIAYSNPIFEKDSPIPTERILSDEALDGVKENLVAAARIAEKIGFDGADIKSCHRYLLSELLSAYTRSGRYGGSYENRTRLLRESIEGAIGSCSGDFIVTTRMNAYDGFPYPYGFGVQPDNGLTPDFTEGKRLAGDLAKAGVRLLNVTMGNPYVNPHVNRPYSKGGYEPPEHPLRGVERMLSGIAEIQAVIPNIPVISSGLTYLGARSPHVAAACIEKGWFAMAGYGRMTFAYPDVARDIVSGRGFQKDKNCITCSKCTELMRAGLTPGCVIRDSEVYGAIYKDILKK